MDRLINMKKMTIPLLCIAALTTGLTGCTGEQEESKEEEKYAVPVEVSHVTQGNVSSFYSTTATLEAPEEAHVVTRIAGLIEDINVEEGDRVIKGQALATIDAKRQHYDYKRSQAEVQIIEQELNRLKQMKNREFVSQDVMAKLEFNLQAAIAQRDLAELHVIESQIVSPIDGIVAMRHFKKGNMAKEFEELFYIVNQDELHGIVHLPEQQLTSLRLGQQARISNQYSNSTNASEANEIIANVLRISPIVDAQSGTFKVTIAIDNTKANLKAGMFTRVELKYDTHEDVVTVPFNAVINQDDTQALYVIEDNTATRREVRLGYREKDKVEVISGVKQGEQIVIRGQQNLKDQSLVEIITPLSYAKNSLNAK